MLRKGNVMSKKDLPGLPDEMFVAESLIRIKALENVLIRKGLVTQEELNVETKILTTQLSKAILEKANVTGDLDAIIAGFDKKNN